MASRIITRPEAKAKGRLFYFTGKPCPHGHIALRYVSGYLCVKCHASRVMTPAQKLRRASYMKKYARRTRRRRLAWHRKWYKINRPRRLRYLRRWYRANREKHRAYYKTPKALKAARIRKKRWYRANRTWYLAKLRRPEQRAKAAAQLRSWCRRNRDRRNKVKRAWLARNRASVNRQNREFYRKYPERVKARLARRRGKAGRYTAEQILAILRKQRHRCANQFCRADLRKKKRHLDHKNPISRGGSNWSRNLQWLCAFCNLSKKDKTVAEWMRILKKRKCA